MTKGPSIPYGPSIADLPLPDIELPPTDLPYDDGEPMESPWHFGNSALLIAGYIAARNGEHSDYFIGANMFVYYSMNQVRNKDFKGPDVFIVKNVDGTRERLSWITWAEEGRYPDVIFELLSPSTEQYDLTVKKQLYEQTFRTGEYFCVAPKVEQLFGWRLANNRYEPILPDARGWLWSQELGLWLGPWDGMFLTMESRWLRYYRPDGELVLLGDEAAQQRAELEAQRADTEAQRAAALAERVAALEDELRRLRGEG